MKKKSNLFKKTSGLMAFLFILACALPAQAFYVEVPKGFAQDWQSLIASKKAASAQKVLGVKVLSLEEANPVAPGSAPTAPTAPAPQNQPWTDNSPNNQGGPNNPGFNQQNGGNQDQQRNQEQMMQDVKRNIKQMESGLNRLESAFTKAEAKGITVPAEVKDKLKEARSTLEAMKAAQTPEAMQAIDMGALNETMQSLEQSRRDVVDGAQRMDDIKRGVKSMESGIKAFENQIARLVKQKIVIPAETTDNLNKIKAIIAAIKSAKTMDEINAAGVEDLQTAMQNLDESRGQLEMLARWPQTLKQMDRQLSTLNSQLKKNKTIVDRLAKQGIDLAQNYSDFADAIQKLKAVRDDAVQKIAGGDQQAAFDSIQNDFFGQMDDVMQNVNVIQTMANLNRFASNFKKIISQDQSQIRKLKAQKLDSGEAEVILNDLNEKGKEILAMLKVKPIDAEAITSALEDMQVLNQDFSDKISELTGVEAVMPWDQGPQQFQQPQMPNNWQQLMPQQSQTQNMPQNNQQNIQQPAPINQP